MAIVALDLTGMNIDSVAWRGARLRADFGGGYGAFAVVDDAHGLHRWAISAGALPDNADHLIDGVSRFEYYYEFFKAHTTGAEEVFEIAWRGQTWHACFVEDEASFEAFTSDLYAGGVEIRQRKVAGYLYNADGSVSTFVPSDVSGLQAWYEVGNSVVSVPDLSVNDRDMIGELPMPSITTNGGVPVMRWNGTDDNPLTNAASYSASHIWVVACATDAVFDATPSNRGLISGVTLGILTGVASDTKFYDMGYGANFAYKLNGTAYADNDAQAPMNGILGVVECKFPSTVGVDGLQIGLDRNFATRIWKGDWVLYLAYNNPSMSAADEYLIRRYAAAVGGGISVIE